MATASGTSAATEHPKPVGYLVNHPGWADRGARHRLRLRARSGRHLRPVRERKPDGAGARRSLRPCAGLASVTEKVELAHGPIPARLFEVGLRWFRDDPTTERFFAVRWDGRSYRLVVPEQEGTATRLKYTPPAGVVAEFHSHGSSRAFFSKTDDGDEQGFRVYGVVGRLDDRPSPSSASGSASTATSPRRTGRRSSTAQQPGLRLVGEEPDSTDQIAMEVIECLTALTMSSCWTTPG